MKKIFAYIGIFALALLLLDYEPSRAQPLEVSCSSYRSIQSLMDDMGMDLVWRGMQPNNRWLELWTDFEDRHNILIEFDNPAGNNAFEIKNACIIATTKETTYRVGSMRKLTKWFNKLTKEI